MNKTPIIFLHGWSGSATSWENNINYFERLGFPVLALKMPGFDLPNPPASWGIPEYAQFAQSEIIKKFPNQKVILIGHSFGGRVSIFLTSESPGLVEALVLTSSAGLNLEPPLIRKSLIFVSKIASWLENKTFLSTLIAKIRKSAQSAMGSTGYQKADNTMKEVFKNVVNLDLTDRLPNIKCPTLIIWGEKDTTTPIKMAKVFNEKIKGSKLEIIKEAEHSVHKTHSDEWNQIVEKFLN